jgi:hypothetical protein
MTEIQVRVRLADGRRRIRAPLRNGRTESPSNTHRAPTGGADRLRNSPQLRTRRAAVLLLRLPHTRRARTARVTCQAGDRPAECCGRAEGRDWTAHRDRKSRRDWTGRRDQTARRDRTARPPARDHPAAASLPPSQRRNDGPPGPGTRFGPPHAGPQLVVTQPTSRRSMGSGPSVTVAEPQPGSAGPASQAAASLRRLRLRRRRPLLHCQAPDPTDRSCRTPSAPCQAGQAGPALRPRPAASTGPPAQQRRPTPS